MGSTRGPQVKNHLLGLETLVQEFPGDIDARAWLAMVTWQNSTADGIGSRQSVDTVLDTVLQRGTHAPGTHHYRIHLWDGAKRSAREVGRHSTPGLPYRDRRHGLAHGPVNTLHRR